MLELYFDGKWHLCDGDLGCLYKDATTGDLLSLKEVIDRNAVDNLAIEWLAEPGIRYDPAPKPASGFDVSGWAGHELATPEKALLWARRILQIPGIWHTVDGAKRCAFYMPNGTDSRQSWLENLSSAYHVKSEADWNSLFY